MEYAVNKLRQNKFSLFYCPAKGDDGQHYVYSDWVYGQRDETELHLSACESLGQKLVIRSVVFDDTIDDCLCTWTMNDFLVQSIGRLDDESYKAVCKTFRCVFKPWRVKGSCSSRTFRWMSPLSAKAIMIGMCCNRQKLLSLVQQIDKRKDAQLLVSFICNIIELIFNKRVALVANDVKSFVFFRAGCNLGSYSNVFWFVDRKEANNFIDIAMGVSAIDHIICELTFLDASTQLGYLTFSIQMCCNIVGSRDLALNGPIMRYPTHNIVAQIVDNCYTLQQISEEIEQGCAAVDSLQALIENCAI